jgi:hypothetical protein
MSNQVHLMALPTCNTDLLGAADSHATQVGLHPLLAALEIFVYPVSATLQSNAASASVVYGGIGK